MVALFGCVGVLLGYSVPYLWAKITNAKYDRSSMEVVMSDLLGAYEFKDVMPHELVVTAYAYNE